MVLTLAGMVTVMRSRQKEFVACIDYQINAYIKVEK